MFIAEIFCETQRLHVADLYYRHDGERGQAVLQRVMNELLPVALLH